MDSIPRPHGRAMEYLLWIFWRNIMCYKEVRLYMQTHCLLDQLLFDICFFSHFAFTADGPSCPDVCTMIGRSEHRPCLCNLCSPLLLPVLTENSVPRKVFLFHNKIFFFELWWEISPCLFCWFNTFESCKNWPIFLKTNILNAFSFMTFIIFWFNSFHVLMTTKFINTCIHHQAWVKYIPCMKCVLTNFLLKWSFTVSSLFLVKRKMDHHCKAWTKWLTFCRWHFQLYFVWNL